jgi:hypothetical protein
MYILYIHTYRCLSELSGRAGKFVRQCASTGWGDSEDDSSSESGSESDDEEESSQFDDELYWSDVVSFFVSFVFNIIHFLYSYTYVCVSVCVCV